MNRLTISTAFILLLCCTMSSCRKEPIEAINPNGRFCNTYVDQFENIWSGLDHGYLFWSRETIDWDSVHDALLPQFQELDARPGGANDALLTSLYQSMVRGLIDHHMFIQVKNLRTNNPVYADPAWDEVPSRDYYHYDYSRQQVALLENMEGVSNYRSGNDAFPCYFALFPSSGDKKIAYLRFFSFQVGSLVSSVQYGQLPSSALAPLRAFYGNGVIDGVTTGWAGRSEVEAVIIDVRGNGGGNMSDLQPLICSLSPEKTNIGYSRVKEGLGRLDYSAWTPFTIDSPANHLDGTKKVVVLADINSVSCSELTALMIKSYPHGTFIGERTYGATCPLIPGGHDLLYSGVFGDYNKNGYYVYTSNFDVVGLDYQSLEGIGVTPDIECLFDYQALQNGHDNQLERALEFIRTGK